MRTYVTSWEQSVDADGEMPRFRRDARRVEHDVPRARSAGGSPASAPSQQPGVTTREPVAVEQRVRLADDLLAAIDERLPLLTSRPGLFARQIAAGGLARCCALNHGMRTLCQEGRSDVVGLLARAVYETVIVSLYVLLKGHQGVLEVAGDHKKFSRILIERNTELEPDLIAGWRFDEDKINLEQMTRDLGPLLVEAGDPVGDIQNIYDLGYRAESTFSAHGFGAIARYLDASTAIWRVTPNPGGLLRCADARVVCILYTGALARHLFRVFGVGVWQLDHLSDQLAALTRTGS